MPSPEELIAYNRDEEAVSKLIGADWLIYQDLDDLIEAVHRGNRSIKGFDCSCFDGQYITNDVDDAYLQHIEQMRSDGSKQNKDADRLSGIDLYSSQ